MLAYLSSGFDFGYTWPWTYGHLILAVLLAVIGASAWKWRPWAGGVIFALAGWLFAGFLTVQFVFGFNRLLEMPTQRFLTSGSGKVLDIGCGSGRATIMVGTARPGVALVALDNFSA